MCCSWFVWDFLIAIFALLELEDRPKQRLGCVIVAVILVVISIALDLWLSP
jgi:hypothetical protein